MTDSVCGGLRGDFFVEFKKPNMPLVSVLGAVVVVSAV